MAFQLPPKLVQTLCSSLFRLLSNFDFFGELHFAARNIFESQIAFRSFTLPRLGTICMDCASGEISSRGHFFERADWILLESASGFQQHGL